MTKNMYTATFSVQGTVTRTFYAENDEEAKQVLEAMQDDDDLEGFYDLEEIGDICLISGPRRVARMETGE